MVWVPEYFERQYLEGGIFIKSKKMIKTVSKEFESARFIDFTNATICNGEIYFYDSFHLNKKEVAIFLFQLSDSVTKYYRNQK